MPSYKEILCSMNLEEMYIRNNTDGKASDKAISSIFSEKHTVVNQDAAKKLLGILFPGMKSATGVSYILGRSYSHDDFLANKNISASECFDRYFSLALDENTIPGSIIKWIITEAQSEELDEYIVKAYESGKIERLLDELSAAAKTNYEANMFSSDRAQVIASALIRNCGDFVVPNNGLLSIPFEWKFLFSINPILKLVDVSERFEYMRSIFKNLSIPVSMLSLLLNDFEKQVGRFTEKQTLGDDALFIESEVLDLEIIFKQRAIDAIDSGIALTQYKGLSFLWLLGQLDSNLLDQKRQLLVENDSSLVKVITNCTSNSTITSKEVTKARTVYLKSLSEFIDVMEAYERIKSFCATKEFSELDKNDQMNAIAFLLTVEKGESEFEIENSIPEDVIDKKLREFL